MFRDASKTFMASSCLPIECLRAAERLVLLLDYDGTLVPFAPTPAQAVPDPALLELLQALTRRAGTDVHIISGRDKNILERWFSGLPIGLHAEHGLWSRLNPKDNWYTTMAIPAHWKDLVLPTIEQFTRRTPGSLMEHKSASIAWHYRLTDPAHGALQARALSDALSHFPVHVLRGDKVVEVKLQGVNKGQIVQRYFLELPHTMLLAMGDDCTDEDLFAALPESSVAVHVGPNASRAPYRLMDYREARELLQELLS